MRVACYDPKTQLGLDELESCLPKIDDDGTLDLSHDPSRKEILFWASPWVPPPKRRLLIEEMDENLCWLIKEEYRELDEASVGLKLCRTLERNL
ncbi:hypothetical protein X801_00963 [Opisthorchis viverrini]|uniref:Uncharacterized protein n=2 Tax=Opisthorchis viverrini TaxID=6198 RepID=A0A1S8X9K7_OPIVI|nr:hypothetical protein T265_03388 [Opisthorchis viverrini]KER30125.1 hypothetical protein T265_03388 [Opisthorchis viverrini]OON23123.1 hypothetical protein X801_00963 [Opisthorchis viverrini]